MNFWELISETVERPLSVEAASSSVVSALGALPPEEAAEFCREFDARMGRAYTWGLWGVAYLANGGCSDDTFMDFRASLILLGESIYEGAVQDPESLLALDPDEIQALFEEGALYIGSRACEAHGIEPPMNESSPADPAGEPWDESREDLMARFPRAWSAYGWDESSGSAAAEGQGKPWWKFW